MEHFKPEKYVSVKTFKKSGEAVATPVGMIIIDGRLYFATALDSFKVVRIRNNPNVEIAASDSRGNVQGDWTSAKARLINDIESEPVRRALARKYRFTWWIFTLGVRLKRSKLAAIEVTN